MTIYKVSFTIRQEKHTIYINTYDKLDVYTYIYSLYENEDNRGLVRINEIEKIVDLDNSIVNCVPPVIEDSLFKRFKKWFISITKMRVYYNKLRTIINLTFFIH
jgi:hypothetical protein